MKLQKLILRILEKNTPLYTLVALTGTQPSALVPPETYKKKAARKMDGLRYMVN